GRGRALSPRPQVRHAPTAGVRRPPEVARPPVVHGRRARRRDGPLGGEGRPADHRERYRSALRTHLSRDVPCLSGPPLPSTPTASPPPTSRPTPDLRPRAPIPSTRASISPRSTPRSTSPPARPSRATGGSAGTSTARPAGWAWNRGDW